MVTIEVKKDLERSLQLFRKYYKFQKEKQLKQAPFKMLFLIGLGLLLAGLLSGLDLLTISGGGMLLIVAFYLVYNKIRYQLFIQKFSRDFIKADDKSELSFMFRYDDEKIYYEGARQKSEFSWSLIEKYEVNEGDVYLYVKGDKLFDIISESIIGSGALQEFQNMLVQKLGRNADK